MWVGLCISVNCVAIMALTIVFFQHLIVELGHWGEEVWTVSDINVTEFWLEKPGAIYFIVFGYPSALIAIFSSELPSDAGSRDRDRLANGEACFGR